MENVKGSARLAALIKEAAGSGGKTTLYIGEYIGGGKVRIGDQTIERDDYRILQQAFKINDETVNIPATEKQVVDISYDGYDISYPGGVKDRRDWRHKVKFTFPAIKKGENVVMWHPADGDYIMLGRVGD